MQILSYSPYDDTGGSGLHMARAFNAVRPEWTYRSVVGSPSYLQYPRHTPWSWSKIDRYWRDADVVHLHDGFHQTVGLPPRPAVVTYHGTGFREKHKQFLAEAREHKAVAMVSTLDLWLLAPEETTWCPAPNDVEGLAAMRVPQPEGQPLRICHAPTARALKGTEALVHVVDRLAKTEPVELVLIERKPWAECLAIKATCDVYFDQFAYGYGQNSIEAMAMGIPVISGAANNRILNEMERRFGTYLPFMDVYDVKELDRALRGMLDPDLRAAWAKRGREHVDKFHSQRAGVELLSPIYAGLVPAYAQEAT